MKKTEKGEFVIKLSYRKEASTEVEKRMKLFLKMFSSILIYICPPPPKGGALKIFSPLGD